MSVYALSANDKESWKIILDPQRNPDRRHKQWMTRTCHVQLSTAKFGDDTFSGLCYRADTHPHTSTHTRTEPLIALLTSATIR